MTPNEFNLQWQKVDYRMKIISCVDGTTLYANDYSVIIDVDGIEKVILRYDFHKPVYVLTVGTIPLSKIISVH